MGDIINVWKLSTYQKYSGKTGVNIHLEYGGEEIYHRKIGGEDKIRFSTLKIRKEMQRESCWGKHDEKERTTR